MEQRHIISPTTNSISRSRVNAPYLNTPYAIRRNLTPPITQNWFVRPLIAALVVLPIVLLMFAPSAHRPGMLMAYGNILIIGMAMIHFVRQRTFESAVPILFTSWLLLSWPISSIYFGFFDPDVAYTTTHETREPLLDGNVRLQAVTMLFLFGYLATVVLLNRRRAAQVPSFSIRNVATTRMVYVATLLTTFVFMCGVFRTFYGGNIIVYIASGLFLFLYAIPLVLGVSDSRNVVAPKADLIWISRSYDSSICLFQSKILCDCALGPNSFWLPLFWTGNQQEKVDSACHRRYPLPSRSRGQRYRPQIN